MTGLAPPRRRYAYVTDGPAIYTQSWSLQGQKTIDWSKFGDVFLHASAVGSPLRAFTMVEEN